MMDNEDRKRVFWLLKKYSSYMMWKALSDAFQSFTDAWEYAVRHAQPPLQPDDFWAEALKEFWRGCECFDRGLPLLRQGDRYIFRYKANWLIEHEIDYARRLMDPAEYVHDWMVNREEIEQAYVQVQKYKKVFWIREKKDKTLPATFDSESVFWTDTWPRHLDYTQFNFPPELPEVPPPQESIIETGKEIPVDGIWEPEWIDPSAKKNRVVNIRSLFGSSEPSDLRKGCMNYFVAGTIAAPYQDSSGQPVMPVRWRLIWQDTRYRDGAIPAEEAEYLARDQRFASRRSDDHPLRAKAGQSCPRTGLWQAQEAGTERRFFNQGDTMSDLQSAYGLTVWEWVK